MVTNKHINTVLCIVLHLTHSFPQAPGRAPLSRAPLQELYDQSMESAATANLDDLQRSWETLKNVVNRFRPSLISLRNSVATFPAHSPNGLCSVYRRVDQWETEESVRGSGEAAALPGGFTVHLHQDGVHWGFTKRRPRTWKESWEPDGSSPGESENHVSTSKHQLFTGFKKRNIGI